MSSKIKGIPHISKCPYIGRKKENFRIVQISNKKYRVDYKQFLFGWDIYLEQYWVFQGFEEGDELRYTHLYFENIESAQFYIRKCTRNKKLKFATFKSEVVWP